MPENISNPHQSLNLSFDDFSLNRRQNELYQILQILDRLKFCP